MLVHLAATAGLSERDVHYEARKLKARMKEGREEKWDSTNKETKKQTKRRKNCNVDIQRCHLNHKRETAWNCCNCFILLLGESSRKSSRFISHCSEV